MMRWIILMALIFLVASVEACILPSNVEFWYPMNTEKLMKSGEFNVVNNTLVKEYDNFLLSVSKDGMRVVCTKKYLDCMDNKTFRNLLDEMEGYGAFDLSKEDKDTIASLFGMNVRIKKLGREDLIKLKIKELIMRFLGRFFCVNYEKVRVCKGVWCSLTLEKSDRCPILKC